MRVRAIIAAAALSVSCAGTGPNKGEFNLISMEQELALGKQFDHEVRRQMRVVDDPEATAYLQTLGERIVAGAPKMPFRFEFRLVDEQAVNAFAVPGGHIYLNTGLVAVAKNESELAGVIAHEVGHAVERHVTEQLSKMYGVQILAGLALGQNPGFLSQLAAQVGGAAVFMRFSRDAERQADRHAVEYLLGAGIDPRGLTSFFETLGKEGGGPPKALAWLASHPMTEDRIADSRERIAKLENLDARTRRDSAEFRAWKRRVVGSDPVGAGERGSGRQAAAGPALPRP